VKSVVGSLRISSKLFLAPLVGMGALFALGVAAYAGLAYQKNALVEIYEERFAAYQESARIFRELTGAHASIFGVRSAGSFT
jgi:hypothetical protein